MFMTRSRTAAVGARSGTVRVIGPRPLIWCPAGTGLASKGWAGAPSSATRRRRCPSGSSKASEGRPSITRTSPADTPAAFSRSCHHGRLAPSTRKAVREIERLPRRAGGTGHSKKVMSEPGDAAPSP
jgi:hypothetical protein